MKHGIKIKIPPEERLGLAIMEFELTVPLDYNNDRQIDQFGDKVKKMSTTYRYNYDFTSENFAKVTNKLEPGKNYKVKIFPILGKVSSKNCLDFLKKHNAILVGGQGLTLVWEMKANMLPRSHKIISFDEEEALWHEPNIGKVVPFVLRGNGIGKLWRFDLEFFDCDWYGGYLVCFCDPNT